MEKDITNSPDNTQRNKVALSVLVIFIILVWSFTALIKILDINIPNATRGIVHAPQTLIERVGGSEIKGTSPFHGDVHIITVVSAVGDPSREYIEIATSPTLTKPINISSWSISTDEGGRYFVGNAVYLPQQGDVNEGHPVFLLPNDTVIISTYRSPIGISFRTNKCSGYLQQFQEFTPPLKNSCPGALAPLLGSTTDTLRCHTLLESIPSCQSAPILDDPSLDPECRIFILDTLGHDQCIAAHEKDGDFYGDEWRIFLGQDSSILGTSSIKLLDEGGRVVDTYKN